jgi:hypothetical protein
MRTLFVTCVDARIGGAVDALEEALGLEACDRLQVPGGPLALVSDGPQRQATTDWVEFLARFKDVAVVHLVSHEHCLAYQRKLGGFFQDEREVLERDLLAARRVLEDAVYGIRVECHLVPWVADDAGDGEFTAPVPVD